MRQTSSEKNFSNTKCIVIIHFVSQIHLKNLAADAAKARQLKRQFKRQLKSKMINFKSSRPEV